MLYLYVQIWFALLLALGLGVLLGYVLFGQKKD